RRRRHRRQGRPAPRAGGRGAGTAPGLGGPRGREARPRGRRHRRLGVPHHRRVVHPRRLHGRAAPRLLTPGRRTAPGRALRPRRTGRSRRMNTELAMIPPAKPIIGQEERAAVDRVLASGMVAQGPEVAAFEAEFSQALAGGREVVAVNSGTSGQHLGMLALGLGPGDEVIVPSFTFAATANTVAVCGATPVFVDVDPQTFTLDPEA